MNFNEFLQSLGCLELYSEDNEKLYLKKKEPLVDSEIQKYEKLLGVKYPIYLKELFEFSNGLELFGLNIQSIQEQVLLTEKSALTFHNWGDGNYDCIIVETGLQSEIPVGQIAFWDSKRDLIVPVTGNLDVWFKQVCKEISLHGTLFHPYDYLECLNKKTFFIKNIGKKQKPPNTKPAYFGLYYEVFRLLESTKEVRKTKDLQRIEHEYYDNGKVASEYVYRNNILHGITRHWYQNGSLKGEVHFLNGVPCGRNVVWDEIGKIRVEGYFKNGKPWEGDFVCADEAGNESIATYKNGQIVK